MISKFRCRSGMGVALLTLVVAAWMAAPARAQLPEKFTNLKVLPKDISRDELTQIMRDISHALGVRCGFCHARKDPSPQSDFDWASDSKPEKETARVMMRMTRRINTKEIPKITTKDPDRVEVRCGTCHHGQPRPWQIEDVLARAYRDGGLDSLKARYTSLRREHHGSATYDFSAGMLPYLAERLAGPANAALAVDLNRFNVELFPESGHAHLALGEALGKAGRLDAAEEELRRAVDLDPALNDNAQWIREQMRPK